MFSYGTPHMAEQKQDGQLESRIQQLCEDTGYSSEDLSRNDREEVARGGQWYP